MLGNALSSPDNLVHIFVSDDEDAPVGRTLANIADNFVSGKTYNIGGSELHTIEELSDVILSLTGASHDLVSFEDSEILTTTIKRVDISKAERDLDHVIRYDLSEGMSLTADWMRAVYGL